MEHDLKTWPDPFESILDGKKTHEIRRYDRPFNVGDVLLLREWSPSATMYTGRSISVVVTYITMPSEWGLPDDMCVMSIRICHELGVQ